MNLTGATLVTATGTVVALCVEHDLVALGLDEAEAVASLRSMAMIAIRYAGALPPPPPKKVLDKFNGKRLPFTVEIP